MKKKCLYIIMIIAIILGVIVVKTKDFNYGTLFSKHQRLEIVLGDNFEVKEIQSMVNQTIKNDAVVRKTTLFGTSVAVDAKELKDQDINNLFSKINEKYSKELNIKDLKRDKIFSEMNIENVSDMSDEEVTSLINEIKEKYNLEYTKEELSKKSASVKITEIPQTNLYDILKSFIKPMLISLAIIMVYFAIRYHKICKKGWIVVPIKFAFEMLLNQAFIIAVIALARIPVGMYIPSILIFIWILQVISETVGNEKIKASLKEKDEE